MPVPDPTVLPTHSVADPTPQVRRTGQDTITLDLTADQAVVLAGLLAHYDSLVCLTSEQLGNQMHDPTRTGWPAIDPCVGYDPHTWHRVLIDLLVAQARTHPVARVVAVPFGSGASR